MSPAVLDTVHVYLDEQLAAHLETLPGEGTAHSRPITETHDRLRGHYSRIGRGIFIAPNIGVHYPDAPAFAPDLIAVLDVPLHDRTRWRVDVEGRGVDFVLEVLADGDRRKDLVDNVRFYASLGIPEYLVFDVRGQSLTGWRLSTPEAAVYTRVMPQLGRVPSRVLGLDFGIFDRQLRIWRDGAEVPSTADLAHLLGQLVEQKDAALARLSEEAERAQREAERAQREAEQARGALRQSILAVLRLRGVQLSPEERAVIEACEDTGRLSVWVARAPEVERVAEMLDA